MAYKLQGLPSDQARFLKEATSGVIEEKLKTTSNPNYTYDSEREKEFATGTTKELQKTLNQNGITDSDGNALKVDGVYGPKTQSAVENYKETYGEGKTGGVLAKNRPFSYASIETIDNKTGKTTPREVSEDRVYWSDGDEAKYQALLKKNPTKPDENGAFSFWETLLPGIKDVRDENARDYYELMQLQAKREMYKFDPEPEVDLYPDTWTAQDEKNYNAYIAALHDNVYPSNHDALKKGTADAPWIYTETMEIFDKFNALDAKHARLGMGSYNH